VSLGQNPGQISHYDLETQGHAVSLSEGILHYAIFTEWRQVLPLQSKSLSKSQTHEASPPFPREGAFPGGRS